MAKFRVNNTFLLKSNDTFVISGDILIGIVDKGMTLLYKDIHGHTLKLPIKDVNFLDKKEGGKYKAEVALFIKAEGQTLQEIYNNLNLKGNTFSIKNIHIESKVSTQKNTWKVVSYNAGSCRMSTKLLKGKEKISPGVAYIFTISGTDKLVGAFYTRKDNPYYKWCLLGATPEKVETGTTILFDEPKKDYSHHE